MAGDHGHKRHSRSRSISVDSDDHDRPSTRRKPNLPIMKDISFRILINARKIGAIIGKQGSKINQLREETGARIKIADAVLGSEERVVIVSSSEEDASSSWSPAQEGLLRLVDFVVETSEKDDVPSIDSSSAHGQHGVRLLVAGAQAGSLIGKGGSTIRAIRDDSHASIRVLPGEDVPTCGLPNDRVVMISGEAESIKRAIQDVSQHLRDHPAKDHPRAADLLRDHQHPTAAHSRGSSALSSRSPTTWANLSPLAALPGLLNPAALGLSLGGGRRGSNPLSALTSLVQPLGAATVSTNFSIASALAGSIIGKGGRNIAQIRQLSGARVRLNDAKEGSYERVIEIAGSPEQVGAAQGLLQAFLLAAQQANVSASTSGAATSY